MKSTISTDQRIINVLLLNASFIENLGLMHGKMGIAIFFFTLARTTKKQIYEDYAGELIDEIYEEINVDTQVNFENGLAGIGWGIEYLVQNGFINANSDEVLEDFDNKLFHWLVYNTPREIGLLNGLIGIGAYLSKRLQNPQSNNYNIPTLTNKQVVIYLIDEIDRRMENLVESIQSPGNQIHALSFRVQFESKSDVQKSETKQNFDLLWDYALLIVLMTDLHKLDIFNWKVEKILCQLLEPLYNKSSYPESRGLRLLLAFTLKYIFIKTTYSRNSEIQTIQTEALRRIITLLPEWTDELIRDVSREKLVAEIPVEDITLHYGTTGIAWLYHQLYLMTKNCYYQKEAEWWGQKKIGYNVQNNGFVGFIFENEANALGILEGLAGTNLSITSNISPLHYETQLHIKI